MFCNVAPFSPTALKTEVASSSKILIPSYSNFWHKIPGIENATLRSHALHLCSGEAGSIPGVTPPSEGFGGFPQPLQAISKIFSELGNSHLISSTFKSINYRTSQHCNPGVRAS
jgi:hypothetical protein